MRTTTIIRMVVIVSPKIYIRKPHQPPPPPNCESNHIERQARMLDSETTQRMLALLDCVRDGASYQAASCGARQRTRRHIARCGPTGLHHVVRGAWVPRPTGVPCTWIWDRATQPEHPAPWAAASSNCPVPPQPRRTGSRRSGSQLGGDARARPRRSPRGVASRKPWGAWSKCFWPIPVAMR